MKILTFFQRFMIYGWVYILTYFPIKLYFSQKGKTIGGKYTYNKISIKKLDDAYFYGYTKDNPYW